MLTQKDLNQIESLVERKLDEKLDEKFTENNKQFMTRSEMLGSFDEIMGELKTIREEMTMLTHRSSNHDDRLGKLEMIHPNYAHA